MAESRSARLYGELDDKVHTQGPVLSALHRAKAPSVLGQRSLTENATGTGSVNLHQRLQLAIEKLDVLRAGTSTAGEMAQMVPHGMKFAFDICATSNWLCSGGKLEIGLPGYDVGLGFDAAQHLLEVVPTELSRAVGLFAPESIARVVATASRAPA